MAPERFVELATSLLRYGIGAFVVFGDKAVAVVPGGACLGFPPA
jgi:hypothetical protein